MLDTIRAGDQVERWRGENRVKVSNLANGVPPLTPEQAIKFNLSVNVNWGEGPVLFANGRRQYESAFLGPQNFFKVSIPEAPPEKSTEWGMFITRKINKILKDCEEYANVHEYKWASVLANGPGPQIWYDDECWLPEFVAPADLRVATDTLTSFKNLSWFGVRKRYTVGELSRKVFGKNALPGWNKAAIQKALDGMKNVNYENTEYTWMTSPEKMAARVKQNAGYYTSDACPTITLWHFYYYDETDPKNCAWELCIVPDQDSNTGHTDLPVDKFLYESPKPVAKDLCNLLHVQFGDLNNDAPFTYQASRSLGFLLVEPCYWTNLARCRMLQYTFEQFNVWLRSADPGGRARASKVELFDRCFVPEGITIVPQTERHTVDPRNIEMVMAQLKQLMSEASQSYVQSTDTGTKKEQTAYETRVKLESVNSMMSGLLGRAFRKEKFAYQEICRRFCIRKSQDPDVRRFQAECRKAGIPPQFVNVEYWDIEPEIPIGSGNPTMAQTQAQQLLAMRPMYDPTAQQEILHEATEVITGDPRRADRWAPIDGKRGVSDAQRDSEFAWGTLMQGGDVQMKEGLSAAEQTDVMIGLTAGKIAQLDKTGGMATKDQIIGLSKCLEYANELNLRLAQDEQQKGRVKANADKIGKLSNSIKAYAQRLAEQNKSQSQNSNGGIAPEVIAKVEGSKISAASSAKIKEEKNTQQMRHKDIAFVKDQQRKDAEAIAEQQRLGVKAGAEAKRIDLAGETEQQ